ncbi:MAG: GNAT family N-acetyltransferase [Spirochaetota bacterium]
MSLVGVNLQCKRHFPQAGTTIALENVQVDRDNELIYAWLQKDFVREYWEMGDNSLQAVQTYLQEKLNSNFLHPILIYIDGEPAGYTELYDFNQDPLADFFPGEIGDRGWHIFLGEERFIGSGKAIFVGHTILESLFADKTCLRVLCEPDCRNLRMIKFVKKLSHTPLQEVVLPDKTALFLECRRETYFQEYSNEQ